MILTVPVCCKQSIPDNRKKGPLQLADIFKAHADDYIANHKLSTKQHKVIFNIKHCRSGEFGYHVNVCNKCGYTEHNKNSCRDRHCPTCQVSRKRKWIQARVNELLPVPYYHSVFTLPHFLFPLSLYNKTIIYNLLFECAAQTLLQFGHDPRHLGATIAFYGILHTWGGKLWQHLHVHFIVAGGGVNNAGQWVEPKHKGKFLFPVHALSKVFRGKFIDGLKNAYYKNELKFPDELAHLVIPGNFEQWINTLVGRNWVVYAKAPMTTPEKALTNLTSYANKDVTSDNQLIYPDNAGDNNKSIQKHPESSFPERTVGYIGKFTNQTAIGNDQLISINHGQISFKFKNYRNKGCWEKATLPANEFIRRFLMHVLPEGFHRIRYFGLFANGKRKANIAQIRQQLNITEPITFSEAATPEDACPVCSNGFLVQILDVTPFGTFIRKPLWLHNKEDPCIAGNDG